MLVYELFILSCKTIYWIIFIEPNLYAWYCINYLNYFRSIILLILTVTLHSVIQFTSEETKCQCFYNFFSKCNVGQSVGNNPNLTKVMIPCLLKTKCLLLPYKVTSWILKATSLLFFFFFNFMPDLQVRLVTQDQKEQNPLIKYSKTTLRKREYQAYNKRTGKAALSKSWKLNCYSWVGSLSVGSYEYIT